MMDRCEVRFSKTVGLFLVCLTLWNTVLGATGGLSLCLHMAGELHLVESESANSDCCHPHSAEHTDASGFDKKHDCSDCQDVTLDGIDVLAPRESQDTLLAPDFAVAGEAVMPERVFAPVDLSVPTAPRAPPASIDTCLLIAEVVVLRL